jgi:hypothetical protein
MMHGLSYLQQPFQVALLEEKIHSVIPILSLNSAERKSFQTLFEDLN